MRAEQAARDVLPWHQLARHIDDFLTDLANASKPRNTIRAHRGDLTGFATHHDGDIAGLTAAPVRAFLGEIAGQAPATRKRAAVASFCRWAVRHELLDASPMDHIDAIEVARTLPRPAAAADCAAVLDAICSRRPRVLTQVSYGAWRLEQAERERTWALFSARAEGISIRILAHGDRAVTLPGALARGRRRPGCAGRAARPASGSGQRAAGDYIRNPTTGSEQLGPPPSSDTSTPGSEASRQ
jgi:Phage integrase, N-terminal SAM-like domain